MKRLLEIEKAGDSSYIYATADGKIKIATGCRTIIINYSLLIINCFSSTPCFLRYCFSCCRIYYAVMANNHIKPHDHLFRSIMARKKVAKEFFLKHLPASLKKIVDFKTLKLQRDSYIGDNLHEQISDLLYSVDFNGISGYIYVLVEHQSKPEKLMPFRILKYMIAIMEDHLHKTGKDVLPIVYPIIMYSGSKTYNYSTNLFDLFGRQKKLALKILWQPCQLVDLATIPDQELDRFLWYGTFARVMKYIHKYRKKYCSFIKTGNIEITKN